MAMLIRLLGKPELIVDNACLDLGTPRQRVTLAVLMLADGRPVPFDDLVDRIWDDAPPARCRNLVATYVSRLRRILARAPGEPVRISHRHGTYTVTSPPDCVDIQRFRAAIRQARAALARGDRAGAVEHYDGALAHWHGPALAGLPG